MKITLICCITYLALLLFLIGCEKNDNFNSSVPQQNQDNTLINSDVQEQTQTSNQINNYRDNNPKVNSNTITSDDPHRKNSDGSDSPRVGEFVLNPKTGMYNEKMDTKIGDTTFHTNGTSTTKVGDLSLSSDGKVIPSGD